MGKKRVMLPASEVDMTTVKYTTQRIQAPYLTGFWLKLFVMLAETPIIGSMIMIFLQKMNRGAEETCAGPKKKPVQFYDILKGNLMSL